MSVNEHFLGKGSGGFFNGLLPTQPKVLPLSTSLGGR